MSPYHDSRVLVRNKVSSSICLVKLVGVLANKREQINLATMRDFFDLVVEISKSNSYIIMIHLEYPPPQQLENQYICHGVAIRNHGGFR